MINPLGPAESVQRLFVQTRHTVARLLLLRVLLIVGLLLGLLLILWLDRGGLRDHLDGHVSFSDVLYFMMVSVTTVGYGDVVPISDRARLIDAFVVTPVRLFVWLIFLGTTYQLLLQKWIEAWRMNRLQNTLRDHVVVCGFGHSGECAARELSGRGTQVLVMDESPAAVQRAAEAGYIGLLGDPGREADLQQAGVATAAAVLICLDRDDAAVLATLTVRHLNPHVRVVCKVREAENLKLIRQAGADATVMPSQVAGYLMADWMRNRYINEYIADLLTSAGRVSLSERPATAAEIGKRMREVEPELVVRAYRNGVPIGFWEGEGSVIREGDVLLTVVPTDKGAT